jgi:crossover junction endodeoxyribonuclease RuvC
MQFFFFNQLFEHQQPLFPVLPVKNPRIDKSISCCQDEYPEQNIIGFLYICRFTHLEKVANNRIILGIDPGTNIMGYGIIEVMGKQITLLSLGVLKLNKVGDHALKLKNIFEQTSSLIEQFHPDELSIEAPFFGKNVQSMLKLGRAQGVAIAAALARSIPVFEYSPRKIKQSITGKGNSSKEQVAAMLQQLLKFKDIPEYLDATDGLAAAMCHYFQRDTGNEKKNFSGWKAFLAENPDRAV